jgi:hypothetical protein
MGQRYMILVACLSRVPSFHRSPTPSIGGNELYISVYEKQPRRDHQVPSQSMAVSMAAEAMRAKGEHVVDLSLGEPDFHRTEPESTIRNWLPISSSRVRWPPCPAAAFGRALYPPSFATPAKTSPLAIERTADALARLR